MESCKHWGTGPVSKEVGLGMALRHRMLDVRNYMLGRVEVRSTGQWGAASIGAQGLGARR